MRLPLLLAALALSWPLAETASAQVNRLDYSQYHKSRTTAGSTQPHAAPKRSGVKLPANAGLPANFYEQSQNAARPGRKSTGGVAKIGGKDASSLAKPMPPHVNNNYNNNSNRSRPLYSGGRGGGLY